MRACGNSIRLGSLAIPLGMALIFGSSGCGPSQTSYKPPEDTQESVASAPRYSSGNPGGSGSYSSPDGTPAPTAPPPAPMPQLYTPMSNEAVAALFQVQPSAPGLNWHRSLGSTASAQFGPAPSGAGWDVPLTRQWKYIVVHHSASVSGSAASFDRAHKARGWDGLGYDFVIGNGTGSGDGEVEVGYRWRQQGVGAHAGNTEYNEHGIGICLVGNLDEQHATARQMAALRALVHYLQVRCRISAPSIIGHCNVPGKETRCPGRYFDIAQFRAEMLGGGSFDSVPVASNGPSAPIAPAPREKPVAAARAVPASAKPAAKSTGKTYFP